jgi:phospholipid transport system substrate-binding protein
LILLILCAWPASAALADTPKAQLQATIEQVVEVLGTIRSPADVEKNKGLFRQILLARFDFVEMTRRTLGSHWNNLDGKEDEFVSAFTQFIERSYLGRLGSYQGERVVYGREQVNQDTAEVDTRVVGGRSAALKVGYRLHLVGNEWKVYDMVIDEVSMVTNYGAQFRRILRTSSLEQLLSKLREKGSDHPS